MKKVFLLVSLVVLGLIVYQVRFWHKIYPNIQVASIPLANQTLVEAQQTLDAKLKLSNINLFWGTSAWQIPTTSFDLQYNTALTAQNAYLLGRSTTPWYNLKTQISLLRNKTILSPSFALDENKIILGLAPIESQINIPVNEPQIQIVEDRIEVSAGENGQVVDERALLEKIKRSLSQVDESPIEIPVRKIEPKLSESQVQNLKTAAEKVMHKAIGLKLGTQVWDISGSQIVSWIDPSASSGQTLVWNQPEIETWITELASNIDRPATNARFRYSGAAKVEEFSPAQEGLSVTQKELVRLIIDQLSKLESAPDIANLNIPVSKTPAEVQTSEVNNLGIKELVARGESDYSGSIPNRIFNLHKAAQSMNGVLVAPGETFSFNKYVGDISAEGGYKQAYVIKQGRTVLGDGGGVCQVSTTMFRAALNAGLPIVSRTAHAYRVHYYENYSEPGFDATIFTPSVDFKFKNDTTAYLLIQTSFDEAHNKLFFDLYGTKDNRVVTISKARVWDVAPPPPALYQDDPTLAAGVVKQIDFPAWGAKAAFDYKVTRDGQTLQQQTFYSNYSPWQAVYLRGTRTI